MTVNRDRNRTKAGFCRGTRTKVTDNTKTTVTDTQTIDKQD